MTAASAYALAADYERIETQFAYCSTPNIIIRENKPVSQEKIKSEVKMKNKLLKTLLIACLIIPLVLLTACGSFSDVNWKFWNKKTNNNNNSNTNTINSVSFATDSWDIIGKVSATIAAGTDPSFFNYAVGDEKTIILDTDEEVTLQIWGFNHDDLSDNSGKAGITIGMKHLLTQTYQINDTNTNSTGWNNSLFRTSTIPTLMSLLPQDLQSVVKLVNKTTTAGNQLSDLIITQDCLFLFSGFEVNGDNTEQSQVSVQEGNQYQYWKDPSVGGVVNGRTPASNRIKNLANGTGSTSIWWLRSPGMASAAVFGRFNSAGVLASNNASNSYGVCLGFCV